MLRVLLIAVCLVAALALYAAPPSARVFDVREHGARGDGQTDDTAAIQAALTAAKEAGGGTVFVPEGTYIITAGPKRLDIGSNTTLAGVGPTSVIKVRVSLLPLHALFCSCGVTTCRPGA
jgi:hypothetical protein